ncbi:MAG: hypothetical protein VXB01_14190 [Opitutae bacterium]
MKRYPHLALVSGLIFLAIVLNAEEGPYRTSLSSQPGTFKSALNPYVILQRGDIEAVIVNNQAVDDEVLPKHRAGYSGVASLKHKQQPSNLFVPSYAGLNFEHIHDGTVQDRNTLFEPRNFPMELRIIDEHTVDLYQKPTPHYKLESCHRHHLLEDGTIEMTFECIPHCNTFTNGYIGLFWASYIHQPESLDIHFIGREKTVSTGKKWVRGITPTHGVNSTHISPNDHRHFTHDPKFPLTLVFNHSKYHYIEPWYYGISHNMAFAQIFRTKDQVRLTQSPSGGGRGNPAWDFQYFIENPTVGQRYQFIMRCMYIPLQSPKHIEQSSQQHRRALN